MPPTINQSMGSREWAMLVALSLLWGGSFFFVEIAVDALPPLTIVLLRVGVAAIALWTFAFATGLRPPRDTRIWGAFILMGLLNNVVPFSLIVWGQTEIGAGLASILNATTPLFTVVVAGTLLSDERSTPNKILGVIVGFVGVVLMIGGDALTYLGGHVAAQLAVLGAAISYAFAGVFGRRFRAMNISPVTTAAGQVTASSMLLVPLVIAFDWPIDTHAPSAWVWAAIASLAILSTALAYILYFRILASAGATNLLLVTFLIPASAILLGVLVLGETLAPVDYMGMLLIAFGLIAVDGRLIRKILPN
ncbi:DMT family transporter [Endozoicomonas sp. G2_2]|uniref:DMT family transporter n=1 Tax=Endozoicomonas sp. G2_2 TaxID=2821092 RepID=UPI001ADB1545|nr:DMT family transporter [Endozoicomonas sp. G2_2]MBO9471796.1 DMT family transporter [Endozoicomonas sp. G2_2]